MALDQILKKKKTNRKLVGKKNFETVSNLKRDYIIFLNN